MSSLVSCPPSRLISDTSQAAIPASGQIANASSSVARKSACIVSSHVAMRRNPPLASSILHDSKPHKLLRAGFDKGENASHWMRPIEKIPSCRRSSDCRGRSLPNRGTFAPKASRFVVREIAGHLSTPTEWKPLAPAPFISSERQEITNLLRIASPRTSNAGLAEIRRANQTGHWRSRFP